jgi:hypothetical protein
MELHPLLTSRRGSRHRSILNPNSDFPKNSPNPSHLTSRWRIQLTLEVHPEFVEPQRFEDCPQLVEANSKLVKLVEILNHNMLEVPRFPK